MKFENKYLISRRIWEPMAVGQYRLKLPRCLKHQDLVVDQLDFVQYFLRPTETIWNLEKGSLLRTPLFKTNIVTTVFRLEFILRSCPETVFWEAYWDAHTSTSVGRCVGPGAKCKIRYFEPGDRATFAWKWARLREPYIPDCTCLLWNWACAQTQM